MLDGSVPLLQPVWDGIRERAGARTAPLWGTCAALAVHVLLSALFLGLDVLGPRVPWISRYRMHGRPVILRAWFRCLWRISWKYVLCVLPASACIWCARVRFGLTGHERVDAAPSLVIACAECFSCLLVFDTLFFVTHYTVHRNSWFFKIFHQSHHMNKYTFALAAQDSGIAELVSQQVLAMCSTIVVGCHPISEILFYLMNIWLAVEDHCGYNFPGVYTGSCPFLEELLSTRPIISTLQGTTPVFHTLGSHIWDGNKHVNGLFWVCTGELLIITQ